LSWYSRTRAWSEEPDVVWVLLSEADAKIAELERRNLALSAELRNAGRMAATDTARAQHRDRETDAP
jgi:hypothetical protein